MSSISVKTKTLTPSLSSSARNLPTPDSAKPKKSLKRAKPDSSPEVNENDENSCEVIFDKSVLKPSKPKKVKRVVVSSDEDSTVVEDEADDVENVPPPKLKKNKSTDGNKEKPKKSRKAEADEKDDEDSVMVEEDAENLPSKPKKKKKKAPASSDSMEVVMDETNDEQPSSSKPKKSKKSTDGNKEKPKKSKKAADDEKEDEDSVMVEEDVVSKKKKTPANSTEISIEIFIDESGDEQPSSSKPKKSKKSTDGNKEKPKKSKKAADNEKEDEDSVIMDEDVVSKKKKKKTSANSTEISIEIFIDESGDEQPSSSKPKKSKKSTDKEKDKNTSDVFGNGKDLPPKKKKTKPENVNTLEKAFAKSNPEKVSKPEESSKDNDAAENSTVTDAKESLPPKPKKKKSTDNENKEKPKKVKKVADKKDEHSALLEDTEDLPPKPKKKKKTPANSDENTMDSAETDEGSKALKPKKSKKSTDKTPPLSKPNADKSSPKESKKKIVSTNSVKKSTQQSIFGFCTVQSPAAVAPTVDENVKAKELFEAALKAAKNGQHFAFKQAIHAAQKLSETAIEPIESECFKFAVLKNRKNSEDYDENENYEKYSRMLTQFTKNICEDTSIINSKAFPDLKYAMENSEHYHLFGSCLAISQFFASFPVYLDSTLRFSAEDLLNAVTSGAEGYYKLTGEILADFLHAFSTYEWFKGYKFFTTHLRDITWNNTSASEICKLFLLHDVTPLTRPVSKASDDKLYDILKGNLTELEKKLADQNILPLDSSLAEAFKDKEFYELLPKQQILIFEHLIELFMSDYFFIRQYDPDECKIMAKEKIDALKKELQDLVMAHANMKRAEKRHEKEEKRPDQQYVRKKANLEKQILYAERRNTLNKLHSALKPLPITLGFDRFHRRYYIFPHSPNHGIYIEEFCQISLDEETEFENDPIAIEIERFTVESARRPMKTSLWYHVSTKEEFEVIKNILSKKGIRENLLLETIEQNAATISSTFGALPENRSLKFKENESELGFLKDAMNKVLDRAEKYSLIHFSQKYDVLVDNVLAAENFADLRDIIVSSSSAILPCAFPPFAAGKKFFRITAWLRFAELCKSYSQMHALLLVLHDQIRSDKLFGATPCPRCDVRFDRALHNANKKIIACSLCYGYIHFKCHDTVSEIDPPPNEPLWICENCKKPEEPAEEENVEDEDEIIDLQPKSIIVANKVLRATKARQAKDDSESVTSSSRGSSRNSNWETSTTRSLRPRNNTKNYTEKSDASFFQEKPKLRSKNLAPPPPAPEKVVNEEILEHYDKFCSSYRILTSLRPIKFEACGNAECTIDLLKKYLHKFKKIQQLDNAFENLMVAATEHFKHNKRKLTEIQSHFSEFLGIVIESDEEEEEDAYEQEVDEEKEAEDDEEDSDIKIIDKEGDDEEGEEDSDIEIVEKEDEDSDIEIIGKDDEEVGAQKENDEL